MDEKMKQFYRDFRAIKKHFIQEIATLCTRYGTDVIPLSFGDIFDFWNPALDKLIDRDFRRKIERKVKKLNKKLNPLWRKIRGWLGK